MVATIVNAVAILIGGLIGVLFRKVIKKEVCENILKCIGIVVIVIAIMGLIESMVTVEIIETNGSFNYSLKSNYAIVLLICIALGTYIGEILKIDKRFCNLSLLIEKRFVKDDKQTGTFAKGFINATLITCVGAMSIFGSIQAALGEPETIYFKSVLDLITCIVLGSTLGYGVIFSAIPNLLYQGLFVVLGLCFNNFIDNEFVNLFSTVGYTMLIVLGLNLFIDTKIKVANMLPSLLLVIIYYLFLVLC